MLEPSPYLQHVPGTLTDLSAACLVSVALIMLGMHYHTHAQGTMPDLILLVCLFCVLYTPACLVTHS